MSFPQPLDKYPVVYLKDTDIALPERVVDEHNLRYRDFKTIATGGKCVIRSCKDFHLSRIVCHKSLRHEIADDPYEQTRFLREARVTAMLQHPSTIPIYDLSRDQQGHYFFTMKLVHGLTLREILDRLRRGDAEATADWTLDHLVNTGIQVCHALNYAHTHGVVHRDIKPGNIVTGRFGEVLVLDWGLAKVWDQVEDPPAPDREAEVTDHSLTAQGRLQATPLYMSPEQVSEAPDLDHRTDIYSFGAVLYEMLTLKHMAWGKTMHELLAHTQFDTPVRPSEKSPDRNIPPSLEAICMRCVEKDPNQRIQTMDELIRELRSWR